MLTSLTDKCKLRGPRLKPNFTTEPQSTTEERKRVVQEITGGKPEPGFQFCLFIQAAFSVAPW